MTEPPVKLLLVDDEPKNLIALSAALEADGRELVCVRSGPDALRELLQQEFALILLDVHMGGMSGFETAELIRQRESTRETPILFITSAVRGEFAIAKGYSLGAVDYLLRPVEADILRYKVGVFVDLYRKTAQVRRQAEELREAQDMLSSVLHGATEHAIIALDSQGVIQVWNDGARRMYGYTAPEMLGKNFTELFVPGSERSPRRLLDAASVLGRSDGEFEQVRRDGARFPCRLVLTTRTPVGAVGSGLVLVVQDRTGAKEAEDARAEIAALRQANAAKDEFLGLVSHELRTPLTTIVGNARTLAGRFTQLPTDTISECLTEIDGNARRLQQMVESMLMLSRASDGPGPEQEPILLQRLVPSVVEEFCATYPDATFDVDISPNLEPVLGNAPYVRQVLENLLSNAIKYSQPPAEIIVRTRVTAGIVTTSVLDRGVGIRAEESEAVFQPFKRLDRTQFLAVGAGLGLAVCSRLIEAMGGAMHAQPRDGGGSEFSFSLAREAWSEAMDADLALVSGA